MPTKRLCSQCKAILDATDLFCPECGHAEAVESVGSSQCYCPDCGQPVEPTDEFCASCGASLQVSAASTTPAALPSPVSASTPSMPLLPLGGNVPGAEASTAALRPLGAALASNTAGDADGSSVAAGTEATKPSGVSVQSPAPDTVANSSEPQHSQPITIEIADRQTSNSNSVGWIIVALVILLGFGAIKFAINAGQRKTEEFKAAAAAASTPRPLTQEEIDAANNAQQWRVATQRANQAEARQRAEEAARQRAIEQQYTDWQSQNSSSSQANFGDSAGTSQLSRINQIREENDEKIREMRDRQGQSNDNGPVVWECQRCRKTVTLPKSQGEPNDSAYGPCIEIDSFGKPIKHEEHMWLRKL